MWIHFKSSVNSNGAVFFHFCKVQSPHAYSGHATQGPGLVSGLKGVLKQAPPPGGGPPEA